MLGQHADHVRVAREHRTKESSQAIAAAAPLRSLLEGGEVEVAEEVLADAPVKVSKHSAGEQTQCGTCGILSSLFSPCQNLPSTGFTFFRNQFCLWHQSSTNI